MKRYVLSTILTAIAAALAGCGGAAPESTAGPSVVSATALPATPSPSRTPTARPTATPTEVLTPTVTSEPTIWDVADQMLAECTGAHSLLDPWSNEQSDYLDQLRTRVYQLYPDFDPETSGGLSVTSTNAVLADDGSSPNPFAFADYPQGEQINPQMTVCEGYALAYDLSIEENWDQDGILLGEAYLFYEVGGSQPYVLDGELREIPFTFPSASDQEVVVGPRTAEDLLMEAVDAVASGDCLAVFPVGRSDEEMNAWFDEYVNDLWERSGDAPAPEEELVFGAFLPLDREPECVVLVYQNAVSGEEFLMYETAGGVVRVPFDAPTGP